MRSPDLDVLEQWVTLLPVLLAAWLPSPTELGHISLHLPWTRKPWCTVFCLVCWNRKKSFLKYNIYFCLFILQCDGETWRKATKYLCEWVSATLRVNHCLILERPRLMLMQFSAHRLSYHCHDLPQPQPQPSLSAAAWRRRRSQAWLWDSVTFDLRWAAGSAGLPRPRPAHGQEALFSID